MDLSYYKRKVALNCMMSSSSALAKQYNVNEKHDTNAKVLAGLSQFRTEFPSKMLTLHLKASIK
ncbi:hypothetical protein KIN20_003136 [Parelaphostrongylus tenuis]|uniref:Uncharacterized protein n=1 Tax=Parelaphostrongylus tenuis TaxID=148309 RepID=A0AAD5QFV4_PARTN|nr:hypothetical protein KIN20_003136 [Parelaphostrongylus tenuis]